MKKYFFLITSLFIYVSSFCQIQNITLEDIWINYSFYPNYINGFKSMEDGENYTTLKNNTDNQLIIKFNFKSGKKVKVIFSSKDFKIPKINSYKFNLNENKILLSTKTEKIYRHSKKGIYYVYDIHNDKIEKLYDKKIISPSFSPDGSKIAFVFENNIYIKNLTSKKVKKITNDGLKNQIINGQSDWVYEEEFALKKGFEWSPNSRYIAYYKFNEKNVKEFSMDKFNGNLYPYQYKFKYPKAGEENSIVRLYFYDLKNQKTSNIFTEKDYEYFPRIKWTNNTGYLSVIGLNRHQNKLDFILVNPNNGSNSIIFSEHNDKYIDIHDNLTFLPNNYFIWTSEKDGYNHIYLKNIDKSEKKLTNGKWEVTKFHGVDNDKMKLYYSSNKGGSTVQDLYCLNLITNQTKKLTRKKGTNNSFFSKGMKYFLNSYSNANNPPIFSLYNSDGKLIKVLEENTKLRDKLKKYNFSTKEFFTVKTNDSELNAWMIKPNDFDENKKYPLLMYVYGGPGSQKVKNMWDGNNFIWHQYLAENGIIIACVDNRGTGGKGEDFKKITYKNLGELETIDQIKSAKYFSKLNYVDEERIGIQGWSYGGFISSLAITKGAETFSMAIAIAPVTDWKFYDNIYTERYMLTPNENKKGYEQNSPINHAEKLKGKYLIIHGSADDNVHIQNTYEMISALVKANKQFDVFIYPDKNHGIYGGKTRFHLYKKMSDYIFNNL